MLRTSAFANLRIARLGFAVTTVVVGLCALMAYGAHGAAADPPASIGSDGPAGYALAWSDEFNQGVGNPPDPKNWTLETGNNNGNNNEQEMYVDDVEHSHIVADPQATDGEALQIESTADTNGYESARMNTAGKYEFQYGYVEARIRIPYGQGIWPAFWMLGSNVSLVGWPRCGEIDIMENIGKSDWSGQVASTLHSPNGAGGDLENQIKFNLPDGEAFHNGYHRFGALWEPDSVAFYVDGQLIGRKTRADVGDNPWPFDGPEYIILNTAIGGNWPGSVDSTTVFPQDMLVDYVRVYRSASALGPAPGNRILYVAGGALICILLIGVAFRNRESKAALR